MKKRSIKSDTVYAFISLLSLLCVNYYQTILYYKQITQYSYIIDEIYEYIAIPSFYYFITAFITAVILDFLNINITKTLHKIFTYVISLALIFYIILVLLKIIGMITIPTIGFTSIYYAIVFSILGCLFALATHKN